MAQPGSDRVPGRGARAAMIAYRCHSPAEPGGCRRPRGSSLSGRARAECRARTGDLLQITKALLIRER